jgi:hypothetical protein
MPAAPRSLSGTIPRRPLPFVVAPTADGRLSNTIRQGLTPVAGFAITAPGFDYDSSMLVPETRAEFVKLSSLLKQFPNHPVALFGHADPVGTDVYNKELAGRRALSVYALLTHQPDLWEHLWKTSSKAKGDHWTQRHLLMILGEFFSPATGKPYFSGKPTDAVTKETDAAIRAFQGDHALTADADAGPKTRAKLFELYMELLTEGVDTAAAEGGQVAKISLTKEQFLGKGEDPNGKADYQSCSEFNPAVVLSKKDVKALSDEDRNHENAGNRRVTLYIFEQGTEIDLGKWPCPTIKEGPDKCKKRFWSDGEERRSASEERRTFDGTQNTFACRFYQRIAGDSPCERPTSITFSVQLIFDLPSEEEPAAQTFTLASTDDVYHQTLEASAINRLNEKSAVLEFTGIRRGKSYTLTYDLDDDTTVAIFTAVPLDDLDDHGEDTTAPEPRELAEPEPPESRVNEGADEALLAFNDIDVDHEAGLQSAGDASTSDSGTEVA